MLHRIMPAGFQDIVEANHIALDVGVGILNGVANTRLSGQVDNDIEVLLLKEVVNEGFIGKVSFNEGVLRLRFLCFA